MSSVLVTLPHRLSAYLRSGAGTQGSGSRTEVPPEAVATELSGASQRIHASLKVLHLIPALKTGGIERWVRDIVRRCDPAIRVDVGVCSRNILPEFVEELKAASSAVHVFASFEKRFRFLLSLHRFLRREKDYDVLHTHLHRVNGLVCLLAAWHGVPVRVAHSHSDSSREDEARSSLGWLVVRAAQELQHRFATSRLACSESAGRALFGRSHYEVLHCGIDLERSGDCRPREATRKNLGFGEGDLVVGHVGRLTRAKNFPFFARVAEEIARRHPEAHFVLVGDRRVARRFAGMAYRDRIHVLGPRHDVPDLLNAMDVLLFPSLFEGLGLTLLEAQAAGLPCVYSASITEEVEVYPPLMYRTSLEEDPAFWADQIERAAAARRPDDREKGLAAVGAGSFNIDRSVAALEEHYWSHVSRGRSQSTGH